MDEIMNITQSSARIMAMLDTQKLLADASAADHRFQDALVQAYGKKEAGNIRYQPSKQSAEIRALGEDYARKIEAWRISYRSIPAPLPTCQDIDNADNFGG